MRESVAEDNESVDCLLSEREQAVRGEEIAQSLFRYVNEVIELANGYGYRFDDGDAWLNALLEFIAAERRCCPFLTFELVFSPNNGPLWLRLHGASWVKAFIAETFTGRVDPARRAAMRAEDAATPS